MLELATSFGAIVSLMADFASSKPGKELLDVKDFTEWLVEKGHIELRNLIEENRVLGIGIKASLNEGRTELLAKLNQLDHQLADLSAGLGGIGVLSRAIYPDATVSNQAREVLMVFEQTEAASAMELSDREGYQLLFEYSKGAGNWRPTEPRFIDDDMQKLCNGGYITVVRIGKHGKTYRLTRQGSNYAKSLLSQGK